MWEVPVIMMVVVVVVVVMLVIIGSGRDDHGDGRFVAVLVLVEVR